MAQKPWHPGKGAILDCVIQSNCGEVRNYERYKTTRTWENFNNQETKMILVSEELWLITDNSKSFANGNKSVIRNNLGLCKPNLWKTVEFDCSAEKCHVCLLITHTYINFNEGLMGIKTKFVHAGYPVKFISDTCLRFNEGIKELWITKWLLDETKLVVIRLPFAPRNDKFSKYFISTS